ncbi:MAG: hypothetical protein DWQ36_14070 [Acidobacteria bacterium]|nr:MAG: hypothetical protein DWQ30_19880 [Acidobacteriota bacterium]REK06333.1 MAG: hypothetical protein DWQ36_14070 [Acidobacteriota bacterium]
MRTHLRTVPLVRSPGRTGFSELLATALCLAWAVPRAHGLFLAAKPASSFEDRAIGLALAFGVDASAYTPHYVLTVAVSVGLWLLLYALLRHWEQTMTVGSRWRLQVRDRHQIAIFAAFTALLQVMTLVRPWDRFTVNARLLLAIIGLLLLRALLRTPALRDRVPRRLLPWVDGAIGWQVLPGAVLLLPLSWPFALAIFARVEPVLHAPTAAGLALLGLILATVAARGRSRRELAARETRILATLTPLLWLPAALILGNELQYRWTGASVEAVARWLCLPLLLLAALAWWRPPRFTPRWWMTGVVLPSSLLQLSLIRLHSHLYSVRNIDVFHRGEQTLPTHQLFSFGKIPFLDLRPVHSLSDMLFQSLFALLGGEGADGLDSFIWFQWMPSVITMLLLYWLLRGLLSPLAAFLLVVMLPATALLPTYDAMALIVPIALAAALIRPSRGSYLRLVLALVALAFWRIDFGIAATPALLGVLALCWLHRERAAKEIAWFARGAAIAAAGLLAAALVGALLASRPILQSLGLFVHSYLVRSNTRARPNLFSGDPDIWSLLQYQLLPAVAVVAVIWFAARTLLRGRAPDPRAAVVAFLAAYSLVISTRALERHTLVEGFKPYAFFMVLCLLPVLARPWRRSAMVLAAVLALFGLRLVLTAPPIYGTTVRLSAVQLLPEPDKPLFEVRRWTAGEARVIVRQPRYGPLIRFLERNLEDHQTFYDFSESPLLYVVADREFPTYLIPNLEHTGDLPQRRALADLERLRGEGRLPIVVFRRGLGNDFGANGGPAEVRIPHITEWIYRHYEPRAMLGPFDVWAEPGFEMVLHDPVYPLKLRRYPERVGVEELEFSEDEPYQYRAFGDDPYIHRVLRWAEAPPEEDHIDWALRLRLASSEDGAFEFFWRHGEENWSPEHSFAVPVEGSGDVATYAELDFLEVTFRIDRSKGGEAISSLRIDPPDGAKFVIDSAALIGVETFSARSEVPQLHDLTMLPAAFAAFDETIDLANAPRIGRPVARDEWLRPDEPIMLCKPYGVSPWDANHLLIRGRWDARASPGIPTGPSDLRPPDLRPPSRGRIYGTFETDDLCCGFAFDLLPSDPRDDVSQTYLVPLTSLWQWIHRDRPILLRSNVDFRIETVEFVDVQREPLGGS